jgi:hypothetical protein
MTSFPVLLHESERTRNFPGKLHYSENSQKIHDMPQHPINRVYLKKSPSGRVPFASEFGATHGKDKDEEPLMNEEYDDSTNFRFSGDLASLCKICMKNWWKAAKPQWIALIVLFILTIACTAILRWTHEQGYTPNVATIPWLCLVAIVAFIMLIWTEEAFDCRKFQKRSHCGCCGDNYVVTDGAMQVVPMIPKAPEKSDKTADKEGPAKKKKSVHDECEMLQPCDLRIVLAICLIWFEAFLLMLVLDSFQVLPDDEALILAFYIGKVGAFPMTFIIVIYIGIRLCYLHSKNLQKKENDEKQGL